jgi:hypothetical protein
MGTYPKRVAIRLSSTTQNGIGFDASSIEAVWNKARLAPGKNPFRVRLDACGAYIEKSKYGDTTSETGMGWEIDHVRPVSRGGLDALANLQPLQWRNNRKKGDSYPILPVQYAAVTAKTT